MEKSDCFEDCNRMLQIYPISHVIKDSDQIQLQNNF